MYADSYMTREEFRQMFDHTLYDKVSITPQNFFPPKVATANFCTNEIFLRCATNLAAEAISRRSTTKSTRRLGPVRKRFHLLILFFPHIFVLLFLIFLSGNEKTEKDLWDVIISVLFVILHILCCIINSNTTDSFIFLVHFLYGLILYCFLKVHFNVLIVQLDPIYSFTRPSESFQEDNREEAEEVGGLEDDFRPILIKKIYFFSLFCVSREGIGLKDHWLTRPVSRSVSRPKCLTL